MKITNAMTVDVEDYFQVSAFEKHISRDNWDELPHRVENNIEKILDIFGEYNIKSTFFILGWIAERYPKIIRKIVESGSEVASHGYDHVRITNQTESKFRDDIVKTKKILEDISGAEVIGYRAASFSINKNNHWAHSELEQAGYKYSSSIYPIKHDLYGIPDSPRYPYKPGDRGLKEIPISTYQLLGYRIPCGGGGYFRLFPYFLSKSMISNINKKENMPCIFYFHPWELDTGQPRVNGLNFKTKFRHYTGTKNMETKLRSLLQSFAWDRMDRIFVNNT